MRTFQPLARAAHLLPTIAVTGFITVLAGGIGWPLWRLPGLLLVVLAGQLSVGWSNDAHDADLDRRAQRLDKPTVQGAISTRLLWRLAILMLIASVAGSWLVAGWVGGSFHVLALIAAWAYNLRLSRTTWSWLAYAVAFGSVPAFLAFGLDGRPPAGWLVLVVGLIGVSAHLANAVPDLDADTRAGVGGVVVRLGSRPALILGWTLLGVSALVLVTVAAQSAALQRTPTSLLPAAFVLIAYLGAGGWMLGSMRQAQADPQVPFRAVLLVTLSELLAVLLIA